MTIESDYAKRIEAMLTRAGYWYVNVHGTGMGHSGVPDLVTCVRGGLVGIEVKRSANCPTISQWRHGLAILASGGRFIVAYEDFTVAALTSTPVAVAVSPDADPFDLHTDGQARRGVTYEVVIGHE